MIYLIFVFCMILVVLHDTARRGLPHGGSVSCGERVVFSVSWYVASACEIVETL